MPQVMEAYMRKPGAFYYSIEKTRNIRRK